MFTHIRHKLPKWVLMGLIVLGLWQAGQGLYIYAKAQLAQYLIKDAWSTMQANQNAKQSSNQSSNQSPTKPWPWADTWPVAHMQVPRLNIEMYILAGDSGRNLAFGPGHRYGTAKPGHPGNSLVSGHRDTHFKFLKELRSGDEIRIETQNRTKIIYEVQDMTIMHTRNARLPDPEDTALLTLVTCYPFDAILSGGDLRYVVTAVNKKNKQGL